MLSALRLLLLCAYSALASLTGLFLCLLHPFNPENTRRCARLFALPSQRFLGIRVDADIADNLIDKGVSVVLVFGRQGVCAEISWYDVEQALALYGFEHTEFMLAGQTVTAFHFDGRCPVLEKAIGKADAEIRALPNRANC